MMCSAVQDSATVQSNVDAQTRVANFSAGGRGAQGTAVGSSQVKSSFRRVDSPRLHERVWSEENAGSK